MQETPTELDQIIEDDIHEIRQILINECYNKKIPSAEWYPDLNAVVVTNPQNRQIVVHSINLDLILKGQRKVGKELTATLVEWYQNSLYRFKNEAKIIREVLSELKVYKNDHEQIKRCAELSRNLNNEWALLGFKGAAKQELAYLYQESGERLERLYLLQFGRSEMIDLSFGSIKVSVDALTFNEEMKNFQYKDSIGFFEDLQNAYDFIKSVEGHKKFSETAGILYSDEVVKVQGEETIELGCSRVLLKALIVKESRQGQFFSRIYTPTLKFDQESLVKHIQQFYYGHQVQVNANYNQLLCRNIKGPVNFLCEDNAFTFAGRPEDMRYHIPRLLSAILA